MYWGLLCGVDREITFNTVHFWAMSL